MIVLHAAPICWDEIGGLAVSIPSLAAAQNRLDGVSAAVWTTVPSCCAAPPLNVPMFSYRRSQASGDTSVPCPIALPSPFNRPDLVVFHSTYIPVHAEIAADLRRLGIPYLICPRGGMTHYAQRYRWWKKRLGNLLFFRKMVADAEAIQCLTAGEAEATGDWRRPMFVAGNGVDLPEDGGSQRETRNGITRRRGRRFVFIGRLHMEIKGLDLLVDACGLAAQVLRHEGASVEFYGPGRSGRSADRQSHRLLAARIAARGVGDIVHLHEAVTGRAKADVLRTTDVFLHTSRTEGHPTAVLEALAHGVPCLLTPGTNVADEVQAAAAGWRVEATAESIAQSLQRLAETDPKEIENAGARASRWVAGRYSWPTVAAQTVEHYRRWAA